MEEETGPDEELLEDCLFSSMPLAEDLCICVPQSLSVENLKLTDGSPCSSQSNVQKAGERLPNQSDICAYKGKTETILFGDEENLTLSTENKTFSKGSLLSSSLPDRLSGCGISTEERLVDTGDLSTGPSPLSRLGGKIVLSEGCLEKGNSGRESERSLLSKLDLNYSPCSKRSFLNFRREAPIMSAVEASSTASFPTRGSNSDVMLKQRWLAPAVYSPMEPSPMLPQPVAPLLSDPCPPTRPTRHGPDHSPLLRDQSDGRHALNYEPSNALDDMMSELQRGVADLTDINCDPEVSTGSEVTLDTSTTDGASTSKITHDLQTKRLASVQERKTGRRRRKRKRDLDEVESPAEAQPPTAAISVAGVAVVAGGDRPGHGLMCPVCLDVLYGAHVVRPCGHTFCEPCLRRLAKYNREALRTTTCPVCRCPIDVCVKDADLTTQAELQFPDDSRRRARAERNNKYMRHPLPAADPPTFANNHHFLRIVSRLDRNRLARRRARMGAPPVRLDFRRGVSLAIGLLLIKVLLLAVLLGVCCLFRDVGGLAAVSGLVGTLRAFALATPKLWGFTGVLTFGAILIPVLWLSRTGAVWKKPLHQENQRLGLLH